MVRGLVGGDREKKLKPFRMLLGPGLAADEPAATGKRWPKQKRVRELTERRTANGKVFLLSDGRVQAEVSPTPVHYRDSKGKYRAIDTRVHATKRAGFVAGNTTNTFTSLFGDSTDRLVRFEWAGRSVELGLPGKPRRVSPVVDGSTVTYRGVFDGADLVYEVTPTSLKEQIVVHSKPAAAPSYVFTVRVAGLTARQGKGKSIIFTGRDKARPVLSIPAPFMFDDRTDRASPHGKVWTEKVGQQLSRSGSKTTITVTPDAKWLASGKRAYPVTIDPTVKIQPVPSDGQDVQIYSGNATGNYNGSYHMSVGTDATDAYRSLVQFPLTGVPAGTQLDDARLEMYYDQTHYTYAYDVAMDARRVTAPWDESTATWDTMNTKMAG
ncbi:MAG: DNRLRE domain-containing protein, partial [Micromonosporaceae bacterium]